MHNKLNYVLPGKRYTNRKTRDEYQVFQIGNHSETTQNMVCYVKVESEQGAIAHAFGLLCLRLASRFLQRKPWFRPLDLFEEKFVGPQ